MLTRRAAQPRRRRRQRRRRRRHRRRAAAPAAAAPAAASGGAPLTPSTDADRKALEGAAAGGGQPLAGRRPPGHARAKPTLRNDLPTTLLVVLVLLAAAAAAAIAPFVRRHAPAPRSAARPTCPPWPIRLAPRPRRRTVTIPLPTPRGQRDAGRRRRDRDRRRVVRRRRRPAPRAHDQRPDRDDARRRGARRGRAAPAPADRRVRRCTAAARCSPSPSSPAFTALSVLWSLAPADSWIEANRTFAYLAVFAGGIALARLAARPLGGGCVVGVGAGCLLVCALGAADQGLPRARWRRTRPTRGCASRSRTGTRSG